MTKTSLIAASALLLLAGQADARTRSTIISLDGMCDVVTVTVADKDLAAALETDEDGRCETFLGGGRIAKTKDGAHIADIGGVLNSVASAAFTLDIQYPMVTGGSWQLYRTGDGIHMQLLLEGTFTVVGAPGASLRSGTVRLGDAARR